MGLDMYLTAKRYLSSYNEDDKKVIKEMEALNLPFPIKQLECEAMYWRKANAIHRWFVNEVQEGEDNCREHYVSQKQLAQLLDLCRRVAGDHKLAPDLLPTQDGFFFGDTTYNNWYFEDIESTIVGLEAALKADPAHYEFYYRSSW
jgi:hypothetical protein